MSLLLFFYSILLLPVVFSNHVTPADEIEIGDTAFSFQLHHIDSLISLNATPETLFKLRLERDAKRVKCLFRGFCPFWRGNRGFNASVISGVAYGSGAYYARLGIGTPPVYSYMVVDTGSDITWIQCSPCQKCNAQTDQILNPARSTSYSSVTCDSNLCHRLAISDCDDRRNSCMYKVNYGDKSFTRGDFARETLTFGGKRIPNVAFGCGHHNEVLFSGAAGILGLARGDLSFPSQIGSTIDYKFSYCLVEGSSSTKPSFLIFGKSAITRTALYTPLLTNPNPKLKRFYYLDLLGFSIGGIRVSGITPNLFKLDNAGNGGVVIDSGTTVTRLTNEAYFLLRDAFRYGLSELKKPMKFALFDTCFNFSEKKAVNVPTLVLHFTGANVTLPEENYFVPVDSTGTFCFAFAGTPEKLSIIGNTQQQGFRIIYDLAGSRVGFSSGGCGSEK